MKSTVNAREQRRGPLSSSVFESPPRQGTKGHGQAGKEEVSPSPSLSYGAGAGASQGAQARCQPNATGGAGTQGKGSRPLQQLPSCLAG